MSLFVFSALLREKMTVIRMVLGAFVALLCAGSSSGASFISTAIITHSDGMTCQGCTTACFRFDGILFRGEITVKFITLSVSDLSNRIQYQFAINPKAIELTHGFASAPSWHFR
eukprot:SAG31_NODE_697_length_12745_cov_67.888502_9_plen_114_part_00